MKKYRYSLLLVLFISFSLESCLPGPDPDPFIRIAEEWKLTDISSQVDETSAEPFNRSENVESDNMTLQFFTNQEFVTNADLSLTKFLSSPRSVFQGTYYYTIEDGEDKMLLEFFDTSLQETVYLYYVVNNMNTNSPTLVMDTDGYRQSLRETAAEINSEVSTELNRFANRITSANFTFDFEKQP